MSDGDNWQQQTLEKLALAGLTEQRRARRWQVFFRLAWLAIVTTVLFSWMWQASPRSAGPHAALIDIDGVIMKDGQANADNVITALNDAYNDSNTRGVIIRINSPGGSPVQAGQINDEITRLRKSRPNIPVYTVVDDMCASGGYYVAAATDRIYVNSASMVGSIGVIMEGFGFTELIQKLGVERRVMTAGENKAIMDPFAPVSPHHEAYLRQMLVQVHQQFIDVVKKGRGNRLQSNSEVFSGLVYTGADSIRLGLADGYGDIYYVARNIIKADNIVDFTYHEGLAERLADRVGIAMMDTLVKISLATKATIR